MPVIEVHGLRKSYGDFVAVHDLDFTVEAGEVLAVLGPNGAGKTTTVEILEGYRRRDAGDVRVLGMDPEKGGAELRHRIGIVLQETGVTPYLTVTEIVTMHAELYPAPRRVDEVIDLVGLQEKAGARVKTLSGGQRRRLDLALGLVGDPELLFLDEPTTGFDPTARRQAWEIVKNLGSLGKTILLTTHYMDEAQVLADRVIVIAAGRIVAEGPPESIGGRSDGSVRIRFRLSPELAGRQPPLAVVAAAEAAGTLVVATDDPTTVLARLTTWALEHDGRLDGLTVERPSLEDVYLALTSTGTGDAVGEAR